jgi:hypothetical protein
MRDSVRVKGEEAVQRGGGGTVAPPRIVQGDAAKLGLLEGGCTHVYACWYGWDEKDKKGVAQQFNRSRTARCIAVMESGTRVPARDVASHMANLGFEGIRLAQTFTRVPCGETKVTAYVFFKVTRWEAA